MKPQRASALPFLIAALAVAATATFDFGRGRDYRPAQGGANAVAIVRADFQANPFPGTTYDHGLLCKILERRLAGVGVRKASVTPAGRDRYVVDMQGVGNPTAVLKMLAAPGRLVHYYFRGVGYASDPSTPTRPIKIVDSDAGRYRFQDLRTNVTFRDGAQIKADFSALLGQGAEPRSGAKVYHLSRDFWELAGHSRVYFNADQTARADTLTAEMATWRAFLARCPIILTGADMEPTSVAGLQGNGAGPNIAVDQTFTSSGAAKFGRFTQDHVGEIDGMVLDDQVLSAPTIMEPILDGECEISPFKTLTDARCFASLVGSGVLPVSLQLVSSRQVSTASGQPTNAS